MLLTNDVASSFFFDGESYYIDTDDDEKLIKFYGDMSVNVDTTNHTITITVL